MTLTCVQCGKLLHGRYWHRGLVVVPDVDSELNWKASKRFCDEDCLFKYLSSKKKNDLSRRVLTDK